MQTVRTEIISVQTAGFGPFAAYLRAVESFGPQHVFLAESLQGPAADCRQSMLCLNRLASVRFHANTVEIEAEPALSDRLATAMDRAVPTPRFRNGRADLNSADEFWAMLRALLSTYQLDNDDDSFRFGFVARLSYDLAREIEEIPCRLSRSNGNLISLDLFQNYIVFRDSADVHVLVNYSNDFKTADIATLKQLLQHPASLPAEIDRGSPDTRFSMPCTQYLQACDTALDHIRAGDIYQVQLGHEIKVQSRLSPAQLFARLRKANPSPYMFIQHAPDLDLVGASPESYVRLEGRRLSMRPIAGTLAKSAAIDAETLRRGLCSSAKENAEHIMLVDLCRNDIGRVCEASTLEVPNLMALEEFPGLYHLISTVTGTLRFECGVVDVIKATFPAGTMVGAPKIRAMEIIESLEVSPRGAYAGAIGLVGCNGHMNLALCIRMASHKSGHYVLRASAGIVIDSNPESEWRETLLKMRPMYRALTGQELLS